MTWVAALACTLALGVAPAAADPQLANSAQTAEGARTTSASMVERGRALYSRHCSHCHGFNMVNPGTISYDLRKFPKDEEARFLNSVANGKNGRMPPWGSVLSRQEMESIWAYVVTGGKH